MNTDVLSDGASLPRVSKLVMPDQFVWINEVQPPNRAVNKDVAVVIEPLFIVGKRFHLAGSGTPPNSRPSKYAQSLTLPDVSVQVIQ